MSKWIVIFLVTVVPVAMAGQEQAPGSSFNPFGNIEILGYGIDLRGFIEISYLNKYLWRGFDVYDGASGFEPAAGVQFGDSGLGFQVRGHRANPAGHEDQERWDFNLYYQNTLFKNEPIEALCRFGWVYYNYPEFPAKAWDLQEMHLVVQLPRATGIKGLVPGYTVVKLWPSSDESLYTQRVSGFLHIATLDYSLSLPGPIPAIPEQVIKFHGEICYNDGVSLLNATDVDHDWSYGLLGVSTDFNLGYGVTFTPAVYHQLSMDDSVNNEDETWFTLTARWGF